MRHLLGMRARETARETGGLPIAAISVGKRAEEDSSSTTRSLRCLRDSRSCGRSISADKGHRSAFPRRTEQAAGALKLWTPSGNEQDRATALCDRDRCLRYRLPELRVMAEKDVRPAPFQRLQPVKGGQHRLAVVHVARESALAEGLTEIASVRCEHDLTAIEPQPKRLMPRRMAIRRQTHHRAIAKYVVLTIDEAQSMAEIEISRIEPAPRGGIGVHTGFPLAALHQHRCVRDQRVAADVIEVKMRVDDE